MAAAGLTRGGFYAHFRSKQELFHAALADEPQQVGQLLDRRSEVAAAGVRALIEFYLGDGDRARVAASCPLVSLSPDVARSSDDARAAYTARVQELVADLARDIPGEASDARVRALAILALCVGGVAMAHAISDERLAAALVDACRVRALATIAEPAAARRVASAVGTRE
jgi:TetR/AcrR family transcriptional repressor of nem operon